MWLSCIYLHPHYLLIDSDPHEALPDLEGLLTHQWGQHPDFHCKGGRSPFGSLGHIAIWARWNFAAWCSCEEPRACIIFQYVSRFPWYWNYNCICWSGNNTPYMINLYLSPPFASWNCFRSSQFGRTSEWSPIYASQITGKFWNCAGQHWEKWWSTLCLISCLKFIHGLNILANSL